MKCDLCGSKKNVRQFGGVLFGKAYRECRSCFEASMNLFASSARLELTQDDLEYEWNLGKSEGDTNGR